MPTERHRIGDYLVCFDIRTDASRYVVIDESICFPGPARVLSEGLIDGALPYAHRILPDRREAPIPELIRTTVLHLWDEMRRREIREANRRTPNSTLINAETVEVRTVFQLSKDHECGPLIMVVDKVYGWGVRAFSFVPTKDGPNFFYLRVPFDQITAVIGRARVTLVGDDLVEEEP